MAEPARDNLIELGAPSRPPDVSGPGEGRRRWLPIVAAIAFAVVSVAFFAQLQRAAALEEQVHALTADLTASRQTVQAYRGHLDAARGEVGSLSEQMQTLEALVGRDPTAAAVEPGVVAEAEEAPSGAL